MTLNFEYDIKLLDRLKFSISYLIVNKKLLLFSIIIMVVLAGLLFLDGSITLFKYISIALLTVVLGALTILSPLITCVLFFKGNVWVKN